MYPLGALVYFLATFREEQSNNNTTFTPTDL